MNMNEGWAKGIISSDSEDYDDWEEKVPERIYSQGRWSTFYEKVMYHRPTDTYYEFTWSVGSTEQQYDGLEDVEWAVVYPKVIETVIYTQEKPE